MTYGVVIPVHAADDGRVGYLQQSVRSVLAQPDCVAVVVDDGSPKDLCLPSSPNLRIVRREKAEGELKTASIALNTGIDMLLSGEVLTGAERDDLTAVCYVHSDDYLTDNSLTNRGTVLSDASPFVYSPMLLIKNEHQGGIMMGNKNPAFFSFRGFPHHASMWSASFLRQLRTYVQEKYDQDGVFDRNIFAGEDRDVTLSTMELLQTLDKTQHVLDMPTYCYRIHEASITGMNSLASRKSDEKFIDKKHGIPTLSRIVYPFLADLPWSLGARCPEIVKKLLRPVRDGLRRKPISENPIQQTEIETIL
jgi:hypothetical protein